MTRVLINRWETSYWLAATSHVTNSLLEPGQNPWTSWRWWSRIAMLTRWWLSGVSNRDSQYAGLGAGRLVVSSPIEGQIISNQIEGIEMTQGSASKPPKKFSCWNLILLTKFLIILNVAKISYSTFIFKIHRYIHRYIGGNIQLR